MNEVSGENILSNKVSLGWMKGIYIYIYISGTPIRRSWQSLTETTHHWVWGVRGWGGGQNDDNETKWQMNSASFSLKRPTELLKPETQRGVSIFSRGHSVKKHMWLAEEQMSGQRENKSFHKEQRVGGASNWVNHLRVKDVTSPSSTHTHTHGSWRVAVKDEHRPLVLFALTPTLTIQPVVDWRKNLEEQCSRSNLRLINRVSPWSSNLHCPFALFVTFSVFAIKQCGWQRNRCCFLKKYSLRTFFTLINNYRADHIYVLNVYFCGMIPWLLSFGDIFLR